MGSETCQTELKSLTTWTDSLLALGWTSTTERELAEASDLIGELSGCGLSLLATRLQELMVLLEPTSRCDEAAIATSLGRLLIALEMTRESAQLQQLAATPGD